jgi:hypothetical protein
MPSHEWDPNLEATTRLFTGDLEEFFLRDILDKARRYAAATAEISETIEALPEEARDEQGRLARSRELQSLDVVLERVRRAARIAVYRRFCRCANALEDERIRRKVARAVVERLSSLIGQLFASFDVPERAESWTAQLERWLVSELQRIPDKEIVKTASPWRRTTDQKAVDQRTKQIGDRVVSRQAGAPSEGEEVRHTPASIRDRIRLSKRKPLHVLIEMFKTANPDERDTRVILQAIDAMIGDIRSEAERNQVRKAVHDSLPSGWRERIGEQPTLVAYWDKSDSGERGPIKTYVSDVKTIQ